MDNLRVARELVRLARQLEAVYSIEEGGLRKLERRNITLEPGAVYALGASSSPSLIIITKADDNFISYRSYPYKKDMRIERVIGEDLIAKGTETWLKTYGKYHPEFARSMKSGLKGGKVTRYKLSDFERVTAYAEPVGGSDSELWRDAEQYGNVSFNTADNVFEIETDGFRLKELRKDKNFKVVKVASRRRTAPARRLAD